MWVLVRPLTGAGRYLKQQNPQLQLIAIEPTLSPVLSGGSPHVHNLQGIGAGFIPDVLRVDLINEVMIVSEEQAYQVGRELAQQEGILSAPFHGGSRLCRFGTGTESEVGGQTHCCHSTQWRRTVFKYAPLCRNDRQGRKRRKFHRSFPDFRGNFNG